MTKFEKYLKSNAISAQECADMCGLSKVTIHRCINGEVPTVPSVRKLSIGLGLTVNQVWGLFGLNMED